MTDKTKNFKLIFPAKLVLRALKATPYKNSAYALSEVVDNAVGAKAKNVHVAVVWSDEQKMPEMIAVLDDGRGMDDDKLERSIQFGYGDNFDTQVSNVRGLGRFGVGLVSSTLNQCDLLEIWSWQKGIESNDTAPHTKLDVSSFDDDSNHLPSPDMKPLPENFRNLFHNVSGADDNPRAGTLVVWRKFHTFSWKRPDTLIKNLAFECGRIYRNFIQKGELKILLSIHSSDGSLYYPSTSDTLSTMPVPAVDPMFLTRWKQKELDPLDKTLFQPLRKHGDGTEHERVRTVKDKNEKEIGKYRIRASHRRIGYVVEKAKDGGYPDPGNAPFGKLAARLQGVSILREGRELSLDPKWLDSDRTISRWLSVSIDFEARLDDYFGVDNSKQSARKLNAMAGIKNSQEDLMRETAGDNEVVFEAAKEINSILKEMQLKVSAERIKARTELSPNTDIRVVPSDDATLRALTDVGNARAKEHPAEHDKNERDPSKLADAYEGTCVEDQAGKRVLASELRPDHIKQKKIKVDFVIPENNDDTRALFTFRDNPGVLIICLNPNHPFYERLFKLIVGENLPDDGDSDRKSMSDKDKIEHLQGKVYDAVRVIRALLYAYARAESEARTAELRGGDGKNALHMEIARELWSAVAEHATDEEYNS